MNRMKIAVENRTVMKAMFLKLDCHIIRVCLIGTNSETVGLKDSAFVFD